MTCSLISRALSTVILSSKRLNILRLIRGSVSSDTALPIVSIFEESKSLASSASASNSASEVLVLDVLSPPLATIFVCRFPAFDVAVLLDASFSEWILDPIRKAMIGLMQYMEIIIFFGSR